MGKDVLAYIQESRRQAERDALNMRAALFRDDRAAFEKSLREYLLIRFSLDGADVGDEQDIEELARRSLSVQRGGIAVEEGDKAINCSNASTAEEKSILFVLVVQRSLHLKLEPGIAAGVRTVPQLAQALWAAHCAVKL